METVQFDSSRYDLVLDYGFRLFVPILMTSTIALGSGVPQTCKKGVYVIEDQVKCVT